MSILKRTAKVIALPFACVFSMVVMPAGFVLTFATTIPVGLYDVGKYIITGNTKFVSCKYFNYMLDKSAYIAFAPLMALT